MTIKLVTNGILYSIIIVSGIWMAKFGKPYKSFAFNIHKLVALTFVIYTAIISKRIIKTMELSSLNWLILILAGLFVLIIFVTGGILSIKDDLIKPLVLIHKLSSGLALILIVGWFYFNIK